MAKLCRSGNVQIHFSQNSVTMQSLFSHISVTFQLPEWHSFLLYLSSRSDHRCRSSDPIKRRISSDDPRLALKHDLALLHRVNCYSETKKLLHVNIPFHQQVKDYTCSIHLVDESRYTLIYCLMLRETTTEIGTISFRSIWVLTIFFLPFLSFIFFFISGKGGGVTCICNPLCYLFERFSNDRFLSIYSHCHFCIKWFFVFLCIVKDYKAHFVNVLI